MKPDTKTAHKLVGLSRSLTEVNTKTAHKVVELGRKKPYQGKHENSA